MDISPQFSVVGKKINFSVCVVCVCVCMGGWVAGAFLTPAEQSPEASLPAHTVLKLLLQLAPNVCKEHAILILFVHNYEVGVVRIQLVQVAIWSNAFILDVNAHFLCTTDTLRVCI